MTREITSLLNLPVYTNKGMYVGEVRSISVETDEDRVDTMVITDTNPLLVENSLDIGVPYRWVSAVGDIIILGYFPKRVCPEEEEGEEEGEEE